MRRALRLLRGVLALLMAFAVHCRAASDERSTRADFLKARIVRELEKFDARLAAPRPDPTVRDLSAAALAKLYLNEDPSHAEALLRRMFHLQNMDPASPEFGMVPWQEGHPEIKDNNSVDFTMLPFAQIMRRFGARLSPEFQHEALPHLKAAIAGVRFRNAKVFYTNIYLMQAACLLLLGEAAGDQSAVSEARRQFDAWIEFTRQAGVTEYDSSTYTAVQIGCLEAAYDNTSDPAIKTRLGICLDYLWSDIAANYFDSLQSLSGPQSRVYDPLFGDENIRQCYYLAGLGRNLPGETLLSDDVRLWTNAATASGYQPAPAILDLAREPERIVQQRFGATSGEDRTNYLTPDFAIGTASACYGPQDKQICLELATSKKLPDVGIAPDALDAPYGKIKTADRSGHEKPHHLKDNIAAVQDKGTVLALLDLSTDVAGQEHDSIATNIVFPIRADAVYLDDQKLSADLPFEQPANAGSIVFVREGCAAAALRIFSANGVLGQSPRFTVKYDGNTMGAARLVSYHYQGPKALLPAGPIEAGIFLHVERCEDDGAFAGFRRRMRAVNIAEQREGGGWSAAVRIGGADLAVALDSRRRIAYRRVNGSAVAPRRLSVNGRDIAAELLDRGITSPPTVSTGW